MRDRETAYAKINLALHVRARRADGYHLLETLFAFAEDGDIVSAEPAEGLSLTISGPFAAGLSAGDDNLVLKAAAGLRKIFGIAAGAAITLDKRLPVAAGIGGGSADASAAIRLLSRLWSVPLDDPRVTALAISLGADVPACLASRTVRGEGVGEVLSPVDAPALAGLPILLINPGVACPTGPVFKAWDGADRGPLAHAATLENLAVARNDLAEPACHLVPEIARLLSRMQGLPGATLVRMSGSGATCFALFATDDERDAAQAMMADRWTLASHLRGPAS